MNAHFFVVLPSNSSMEIFPDNTVTHFKTQLPNRITLSGSWEVGLCEMLFTHSFLPIPSSDFWIRATYTEPGERGEEIFNFEAQSFDSVDAVADAMNKNEGFRKLAKVSISSHVWFELDRKVSKMTFSPSLTRLFNVPQGFIYGGRMSKFELSKVNMSGNIPKQLFVYCDVIEPQLVGDALAPLLRNVSVGKSSELKARDPAVNIFTHPHYVPVLKREFQTIEIDIRDGLGYPVPFSNGPLTVKLHFRKIQ